MSKWKRTTRRNEQPVTYVSGNKMVSFKPVGPFRWKITPDTNVPKSLAERVMDAYVVSGSKDTIPGIFRDPDMRLVAREKTAARKWKRASKKNAEPVIYKSGSKVVSWNWAGAFNARLTEDTNVSKSLALKVVDAYIIAGVDQHKYPGGFEESTSMVVARELAAVRQLLGTADEVLKYLEAEDPHIMFGDMKVKSVKERLQGDKVELDVVIEYTKAPYVGIFKRWDRSITEREEMEALVNYVRRNKAEIVKAFSENFNKGDYPMWRIFGDNPWKGGGEEYENLSARVTGIKFGKVYFDRREVSIPATVKVTFKGTKLPDMSTGPYDQMSDREMTKWVNAWADESPEWFWADGEYKGTYQNRVRQIMTIWRHKNPHAQRKHLEDLKRQIR